MIELNTGAVYAGGLDCRSSLQVYTMVGIGS